MIKKIQGILAKYKKFASIATIISAVVLTGVAASNAYLTDTERSLGNLFAAADMNLTIDNACEYNGRACVFSDAAQKYLWDGTNEECYCAWSAKDLTDELIFNFPNLQPGHWGKDSVSIHIEGSSAWVCAEITNLVTAENGCGNSESADGDTTCGDVGLGEGELQDHLKFSLWKDENCNNLTDPEETVLAEGISASEFQYAVSDSTTGGGPIAADSTYCLGVAWELSSEVTNIVQGDSITGDVSFTAVQAEGAESYVCFQSDSGFVGDCLDNADCNDANFCTNDYCDQNGVCQFDFNAVPCDDGIFCNGTETCNLGSCSAHSGSPCPGVDGDSNCSESCNEASDDCTAYDPNNSECFDGYCSEGQCIISAPTSTPAPVAAESVWINEIHYDNDGVDAGEGVEIAGLSGSNLSGWQLYFYNGVSPFTTYMPSVSLSGSIPDQDSGYGTIWFDAPGIQNGSPDGIALVDSSGIAVQFLSYEGVFTAVDGPANGMASTDIGVFEPITATPGFTLQLQGDGNSYTDFVWAGPIAGSLGAVNTGQTFVP